MDRDTTATLLVAVGLVLVPLGAWLLAGMAAATLAGGVEALLVGLVLGWE